MSAAWILAGLSCVFAAAAILQAVRRGHVTLAARTWLCVALIFAVVSAWLLWGQGIAR